MAVTVTVGNSPYPIAATTNDTDWASYTPTFTACGTIAAVDMRWRRAGGDVLIRGFATIGTPTAAEARMTLPTGLTSSAAIGTLELAGYGISTDATTSQPVLMEASRTYVMFGVVHGSAAGYVKQNGDTLLATGATVSINAKVPITGWTV